jgi:metal iron transporter
MILSDLVCLRCFLWLLLIAIIAAATVFAIALLAAGQVRVHYLEYRFVSNMDLKSSSIIATVAGQAVSEGFLNWRVSVSRKHFHSEP